MMSRVRYAFMQVIQEDGTVTWCQIKPCYPSKYTTYKDLINGIQSEDFTVNVIRKEKP